MKTLRELVVLVTNKKIKKIDAFDSVTLKNEKTLYTQMFHGILDGQYKDDNEASHLIYKEESKSKKYLMLKGRLKERLLNSIFFLDNRKAYESELLLGVYNANRNYFAAKTLISNGATSSALEFAKTSLNLSIKYQQTELILLNGKLIKSIITQSNLKDFKKYQALCKDSMKVLRAETNIESYYQELILIFNKSQAYNPKVVGIAKNYYLQSKSWSQVYKSYLIKVYTLRIGLIYYQVIRNYRLLVNTANRLEKVMTQNPVFSHKGGFGETALFKMSGYMYLKDYSNGKKFGEKGLTLFIEGRNNWFVFNEHYFLLAMHTANYFDAELILQKVTSHEKFQLLKTEDGEKWKLFEAYLLFIYNGNSQQNEFRILKFVNEVQTIAKDKGGINPAILIIQLLHMIKKGDWDNALNRSESLRVYVSRNLSPKLANRTILFSKILITCIKYRYDASLLKKRVNTNLNKLLKSKISDLNNTDALEIIPYEDLWKAIQVILKSKRSF